MFSRNACRSALARRGVATITFPADLQDETADKPSPRVKKAPHNGSDAYGRASGVPDRAALQRAADILNAGEKVALLVGQGALGATTELEQLAEQLGAPIIKALLGESGCAGR